MAKRSNSPAAEILTSISLYCSQVIDGTIPAGRLVKLAVQRHLQDLERGADRGIYFDETIAAESILFIECCCKHSKGEWAGKPVILSPWQRFVVASLMGWRLIKNGFRRYRKALIEVARKNGKSTLCAALGLLLLIFDDPIEHGAEIYVAATKIAQARIIHGEAVRMAKQAKTLRSRLRILKDSITFPATEGFFQPLGHDGHGTDGLNPHAVFMDELHAWRTYYRDFHEKLTTGSGARRQPLFVTITTAGDDRSTLWHEEHAFAVQVLNSVETGQIISDSQFAFLATIDADKRDCLGCKGQKCRKCDRSGKLPGDDPFNEKLTRGELLRMLAKANPGLGVSVAPEYLLTQYDEALHKATARNSFLRYHANTRVESVEKAITTALWASCGGRQSDLRSEQGFGAFDLGRTDDFAAISLVFPFAEEDDDGKAFRFFEALTWSFTVQERPDSPWKNLLDGWVKAGRLEAHPGDQVDFSAIEDRIVSISQEYDIKSWAYDPTFAGYLGQRLSEIHGLTVFPFPQAAHRYNEPVRKFLALLRRGNFCHGDDPVLAWQAGNLCIRRNSRDEWMPEKIQSPGKIDAMVALLMAFSEALFDDREQHGVRSL